MSATTEHPERPTTPSGPRPPTLLDAVPPFVGPLQVALFLGAAFASLIAFTNARRGLAPSCSPGPWRTPAP